MAATQRLESLAAAIDRVIEYFNARKLDLPDGLFERKTQFVINGAPFETLLGQPPNDPLVLMLARGPAGFRFTTKTLQHAMPDAKLSEVISLMGTRSRSHRSCGCREIAGLVRKSGGCRDAAAGAPNMSRC